MSRWTVPGYAPTRELGDHTVVASHTATGTVVAVRFGVVDAAYLDRARRFAERDSPHLTAFYEYVQSVEGQVATVREFVDGASLASLGTLHPKAAVVVLHDLLAAVESVNTEHGLAHGGVKAENVLVNRQGAVKLADFSAEPAPVDEIAVAVDLLRPMLTGRKLRNAAIGGRAELAEVARKAFGAGWLEDGRRRLVKLVGRR